MRISDWSSDVCSSDLSSVSPMALGFRFGSAQCTMPTRLDDSGAAEKIVVTPTAIMDAYVAEPRPDAKLDQRLADMHGVIDRSEGHTSELPSLMRISYAVFCLQKKNKTNNNTDNPKHTH